MDLDPGTVVASRYRISRPLGRGGMGEVFAAENIRTGRPVAIKLLRQDSKAKSAAVARFRQEARAAGKINSDHVTQVLELEEDPEHGVVLVFELLEGESLIDRLKRTGPIPFDELWPIIEQVWIGLADAHRVGIIHRDLKPSNVFLERRPDGTTRVKILDFGISKVPKEVGGETLTEMGQSLGTFSFMPPEQIGKAKTVDHRADVYACATLIYQSLTGQLPYNARNILVMVEMKTKTDARKLGDAMTGTVDPRLEDFVARGLSRDPSQRYQTALEALEAWRDLRPHGAGQRSGLRQDQPGHAPGPGHDGLPSSAPKATPSSAPRPRSQPPRAVQPSPAIPRMASRAQVSVGPPIPRLHDDIVEMTTDETAATIAMPMPHLKKALALPMTPPLAPRLDSATASIGNTGSLPAAAPLRDPARPGALPVANVEDDPEPIGPGGTQLVMVRGLEKLGRSEGEPRSGGLPAHPAGYYLPPAVQASLGRGSASAPEGRGGTPLSDAAAPRQALPTGPSGLPRAYDDASSQSSNGGDGDVRTQVYRPEETGPRLRADPSTDGPSPGAKPRAIEPSPVPARPKRGVPLALVLLGFLLVGFAVVAGMMVLLKR